MSHEGISHAAAPARITRIESESLRKAHPSDPTGRGEKDREIGHYGTIQGVPGERRDHEGRGERPRVPRETDTGEGTHEGEEGEETPTERACDGGHPICATHGRIQSARELTGRIA